MLKNSDWTKAYLTHENKDSPGTLSQSCKT